MRLLPTFALAPLFVLGCNTAKLEPAPDASPNCGVPVAEAPCVATAAPGCTGDLSSGAVLGRDVVVDASYPSPCTLVIYDPVPDEQNQCIQLGTCHCDADGGTFTWHCFK